MRHRFRPDGAVVYDERLLRFEPQGGLPAGLADHHRRADHLRSGHRGLPAAGAGPGDGARRVRPVARPRGPMAPVRDGATARPRAADQSGGVLGVDVGVVNLALDSDGGRTPGPTSTGCAAATTRCAAGSSLKGRARRGAAAALPEGRPARFQQDVNHTVAKRLVATALATHRSLAVEALDGIRGRLRHKASRDQRRLLGGWGFHQLRSFLEDKAQAVGVTVYAVDPRHTSRACPSCGLIDRKNRPDQAAFTCIACGFAGHADHVAAINIARRGALMAGLPGGACPADVTQPHVPGRCVTPHGSPSLWCRIGFQGQARSVRAEQVTAGVPPERRAHWVTVLSTLEYWDTTFAASRQAGAWLHDYRLQGTTLGTADTLTAAVAVAVGATLLTRNVKDYPMPGLQVRPP